VPNALMPLPDEARRDFDAKVENYKRVSCATVGDHTCIDSEVEMLAAKQDIWWTDLAQVECCTSLLLDNADVKARLRGWRRRMAEVIGQSRWDLYNTNAPNINTASADDLRADLIECIRSVYYFYETYGVSAKSRSDVTVALLQAAGCTLAFLIGFAAIIAFVVGRFAAHTAVTTSTASVVSAFYWVLATSAMAVLGSVVSVQRRLQDPTVTVDPFYRYITTDADRVSVAVISPIFAAIFGTIIYAIFAAGLLIGPVFPKITNLTPENATFGVMLLLYGFVSGFAEQLIPDALTRIANNTLSSLKLPSTNGSSSSTNGSSSSTNGSSSSTNESSSSTNGSSSSTNGSSSSTNGSSSSTNGSSSSTHGSSSSTNGSSSSTNGSSSSKNGSSSSMNG
jgi:hypothetical protein